MNRIKLSPRWNGASWSTLPPALQSLMQAIRSRLEIDLPAAPYYTRNELASLIRINAKTLANDKTPAGGQSYPVAVRIGRQCVYPRHDVLDWLTQRELESRMRRIHRCN